MESAAKPTTMSENARAAAKLVAVEQQQAPGQEGRGRRHAEGYDGFKVRSRASGSRPTGT
jgi:hypothetical protein